MITTIAERTNIWNYLNVCYMYSYPSYPEKYGVYRSEATLQAQDTTEVQSPRGGGLNWKRPKAPSPQCKSNAPIVVRGPTTNPKPKRKQFKLEGAGGPLASIQFQSSTTSSRHHYKSEAQKEAD